MKLVFAPLFFCLAFSASAQTNIDVLHYKYELSLSDRNDTVYGKADITFITHYYFRETIAELTKLNSSGKGMKLDSVFLTTKKLGKIFVPQIKDDKTWNEVYYDNNNIVLFHTGDPPRPKILDTFTVTVCYHGIPSDGLIISKNKYGNRTFFADNWPNRAHNWLPCVDDPSDKASVEFIVTAPSHYQVVANGVLMEETNLPDDKKLTHWKEDVPLPTKVMVIGVAEFAVNNIGDVNCIPVSSWVFPENKKEGFYDYALAKDVLAWHINYIGPYAYKKLANVQSKTMFGGMENAGAIFYYEGSVSGTRAEEELQSHEIVHQWFGNMATEKSFAHLWLSEGFATYLTHVYVEAHKGSDILKQRLAEERINVLEFVKENKRPVVDTTHDYMKLLNANSYQKGSWVLHMLRRQLSDTVFHKSIRDYYAAFAGKNADTKDLQKIFEKNSGKNLEQFFQQWLYTPENPELKISWQYLKKEQAVAITVEQVQNTLFTLPLEITVTANTSRTQTLQVKNRKETFKIPVKGIVSGILPDPNVSLLAAFTVRESK